ncbi:cullin family domain-containing protein [Ditylenchus destructor]|uniref:Cullin-4 n=1 Tax=Ditylenchus destructor TaxID=166010 RepID=A0AAD4R1S6_9BILA|nr:cullin family domain-containing protein [Ditylenchus destructor]
MEIAKPTKKLVIRNFKLRNADNGLNFEHSWTNLEESVRKIQQEQKTSARLEELYSTVENLCQSNYSAEMYNRLQVLIKHFAETENARLVAETQNVTFPNFLESLDRLWERFCRQMTMVRSIFLFLDKTYRHQNTAIASLWDSGLEAFRCVVVDNTQIKNRTVQGLLTLIETERAGVQVNRQLLKSLLRMFMNLQIYDNLFESEFLKSTQKTYEAESRVKSQELEIGEYLRHISRRIKEEEERIDLYLEFSTAKKLLSMTDECFIGTYVDTIIAKGTVLLDEKRMDELSLMYNLLSRVKNGLPSFKNAFSAYIKKIGRVMVMDIERDKTLVQDLMDMKAGLDTIIQKCFKANDKLIQAEKDAFDYFINTRPNRPAELIAKFMDSKLRTGNKECSDEELDCVMDKVIVLFRFVHGRDVFEAFYKKDLAKRLLLGRSASVDAEKAMLAKLKNECGAGFTQKLEGMFKDMEISKEFCATFKQYLDGTNQELSINRLEFNAMDVNIPPQLNQFQQICEKFYTSKHNGRKLQWQYNLASAILKATFKSNVSKEFDVSLFQAMILFLFNKHTEWGYEDILRETKIDDDELKRTLQSLACGKFRVLHKVPKGKDVNSGDKFIFNLDFNDRLHRIRISQVQMRETEAEHQQTEEQIFQDRQYQIDAAVVRIMKMRKTITHNMLMSELFNQLRFPTKPADLKKRIESLIEREYMNRDKEDAQLYHYVA